jgi:hypothetical protein
MAATKALHFKFEPKARTEERRKVLSALRGEGAGEVKPLFPDVAQEDLKALYSVHYQDDRLGERLLDILNQSGAVEFAEEAVRRKAAPRKRRAGRGAS